METKLIFEKIKGFFSGVTGNPKTVTRLAAIAGGIYMLVQAYKQFKLAQGTDRFRQLGSLVAGSTLIYRGLTATELT